MTEGPSSEENERRRRDMSRIVWILIPIATVFFLLLVTVAVTGASAPLRLIDGAYLRSDGKVVVIVRDLQHHFFGPFAVHLLGKNAGFFRSLMPVLRNAVR
jgi:hypothetical protein